VSERDAEAEGIRVGGVGVREVAPKEVAVAEDEIITGGRGIATERGDPGCDERIQMRNGGRKGGIVRDFGGRAEGEQMALRDRNAIFPADSGRKVKKTGPKVGEGGVRNRKGILEGAHHFGAGIAHKKCHGDFCEDVGESKGLIGLCSDKNASDRRQYRIVADAEAATVTIRECSGPLNENSSDVTDSNVRNRGQVRNSGATKLLTRSVRGDTSRKIGHEKKNTV
jgi:hypothetical protein